MYYADILPRPSGEMLGDMLLQMGQPTEGLHAYEAALKLAPNRLDSLIGASVAAKRSGDLQASDRYLETIKAEDGQIVARP
jgi:cytochrome c-type biogenesis protein CcmH/NrfG